MNKAKETMLKAYLAVTNKIQSFMAEEDGMETVQAIILIVVGLVIVGALITTLTGEDGIVENIKNKINGMINDGKPAY